MGNLPNCLGVFIVTIWLIGWCNVMKRFRFCDSSASYLLLIRVILFLVCWCCVNGKFEADFRRSCFCSTIFWRMWRRILFVMNESKYLSLDLFFLVFSLLESLFWCYFLFGFLQWVFHLIRKNIGITVRLSLMMNKA